MSIKPLTVKFSVFFLALVTLISWAPESVQAENYARHLNRNLNFCGEPVAINQSDVYQAVDQNLVLLAEAKSRIWLTLRRAGRFLPPVAKELQKAGVPADLIFIPMTITSLAPNHNGGGRGIWRLKEVEAKALGLRLDGNIDERLDPVTSTAAAARRLKELHSAYGSWTTAMAAYLVGDTLVSQAITEAGGERNYYRIFLPDGQDQIPASVIAGKIIFQDPGAFGYHQAPDRAWSPLFPNRAVIQQATTARELAARYKQDYKTFRDMNPHLLTGIVPAGVTVNVP